MGWATDTFRAPSWMADALVKDDVSALPSAKDRMAVRWVKAWARVNYGWRAVIVSCEEAGPAHDMSPAIPPPRSFADYTRHMADIWMPGDSRNYVVLYREPLRATKQVNHGRN